MPLIRRFTRLLMVAALAGLSVAWVIWAITGFSLSDADAYRLAAGRLVAGEDIYILPRNQDEAFRYAPWFAAAWIPLSALPEAVSDALWAGSLAIACVVAVLPLARQPHLSARLLALLGCAMLLWTAARGNVHPLVMVALIHGIDRRTGPFWVALAASLKAVPILFVLVYVARREWGRAFATVAITAALVAPAFLLGWELGTVEAGASISLYYLASPAAWAIIATVGLAAALYVAWRTPRHAALAAGVTAVLVLPRLLLYDLTYLLVAPSEPVKAPMESP